MHVHVERRHAPRHPFSCDVTGAPSTRAAPAAEALLSGSLIDISPGGAGLIGDRAIDRFTVLRWRLHVPQVPVPLPILAQVRWVEPIVTGPRAFRLGILFLA